MASLEGQWRHYFPDDLTEIGLNAWIDRHDLTLVQQKLASQVTSGDPYHLTYTLDLPQGSRLRVQDQGQVLTVGETSYWVGLITAAKTQDPFLTLLARMNEGVLIVDLQGRIEFANDRFCQMFDYSPAELVGRDERDVVAENDREQLAQRTASRHQGIFDQYQVQIRTGTGKLRTTLVSGTPLWDDHQRVIGTMGILTDVTEAVQQGQSLDLLQTMIQSLDQCHDLPEILSLVLQRISQIIQWSFAEAWIPTDPDQLTYLSHWFARQPALDVFGEVSRTHVFHPGEGLPGRVWACKQPEWIADLTQDPVMNRRDLALSLGLRACVGVPLLADNGTVLAVLVFFSPWVEDPNPRLINLISGVLLQVGAVWQRREAEARFRGIFENAIEGIFQTSRQGHYLNVNPALARIYGYDSPQALMDSIQDIAQDLYVDPNRRQQFQEILEKQGSLSRFESQVYRRDGSIIWISEDARAVRDPSDKLLYYEGLVQDITEQRLAQEALERSLSLLQTTLDATADGIISVTASGHILTYNQRFSDMWGIPETLMTVDQQEARTQFLANLTRDPAGFLERIASLYNTDEVAFDLVELLDGRVFERHSRPQLLSDSLVARVWSYRDVTEAKKIERLKNEFVSMVSHELRTPLTSIRGALGLIRGGVGGALPEQVRSLLDIADKNSERLVLLINDILDIDKIESGQMTFDLQPTELAPIVVQTIAANQTYADQYQVHFALNIPTTPEPIHVRVDHNRLTQVITNLLSNAAKFSPPQGTVTVRLLPSPDTIRLEVIDHGPGIPEEFRSRIFQKFAQADSSATRKKGGTGLGLSICKSIMERMGGQIGFTSVPNVETTFFLELPIWRALPPDITTAAKAKILICEDDADIAHLLRLLLKEGNFHVDIASTAAEVREKLQLDQPDRPCPYAAMTLDLALPDESGVELLQTLRSHAKTAHLPVIVVSASDRDPSPVQGGGVSVLDWLPKPIDQDRLLRAIHQATNAPTRPRILHIEDDPDILRIVAMIIENVADVTAATTMQQAVHALESSTFDLILLDWGLPDGSGFDLLAHLNRQQPQTIPVVVFSASDVAQTTGENIAAALIKSQTSNQQLIDTIQRLINSPAKSRED
ncbi:MAG: PAS domain S-box protein [Synechococcales cyanobacterium]